MFPGLLALVLAVTPLPNAAAGEVAAGAPRVDIIYPEAHPAAASDGTNWLVAWSTTNFYSNTIHAMLVDAEGRPLLPNGLVLDAGTIGDVAGVAWSGRYYLVVSGGRGSTEGIRVDAAGHPVDAKPFVIHPETRVALSPHELGGTRRVAWDGREFVVTATVETLQNSLFPADPVVDRPIVSLVGEDGSVINAEVDLGGFFANEIASAGGVTVLADGGNVRTLESDVVVPALTNVTSVEITEGGGNFLVVGLRMAGLTPVGIVGRFLDAAGRPLGVELPIASANVGTPAVAWDGTSFVVSWTDDGLTLRGTRVRLADPLPEAPFTIASDRLVTTPALAGGNMSVLALWSNVHIVDSVVTESGSTPPLAIDAPAPSEIGPLPQSSPMLATAGNGSVALVWSEATLYAVGAEAAFDIPHLRFERITADGTAAPNDVAAGTAAAVATNGTQSLIVQQPNSNTLRALLLDAGGRVTSTTDIAMPPPFRSGGNVRAIASGDRFVIVWSELTTDPPATIYAAAIDANGVTTAAKPIGSGSVTVGALAASRDRVLVVVVGDHGALNGIIVAPTSRPSRPIRSPRCTTCRRSPRRRATGPASSFHGSARESSLPMITSQRGASMLRAASSIRRTSSTPPAGIESSTATPSGLEKTTKWSGPSPIGCGGCASPRTGRSSTILPFPSPPFPRSLAGCSRRSPAAGSWPRI